MNYPASNILIVLLRSIVYKCDSTPCVLGTARVEGKAMHVGDSLATFQNFHWDEQKVPGIYLPTIARGKTSGAICHILWYDLVQGEAPKGLELRWWFLRFIWPPWRVIWGRLQAKYAIRALSDRCFVFSSRIVSFCRWFSERPFSGQRQQWRVQSRIFLLIEIIEHLLYISGQRQQRRIQK